MADIVAVTGATGYVGRFVVAELQRRGMMVRALARPESDRGGFGAPIEWVMGDLRAGEGLDRLVEGADAVVHLAYAHVPGRYRGGEGDDLSGWLEANLNGSLRLIEAADRAQVQRVVFLSSRAVFSKTLPGRELDETHPTWPDTHYGAYKAAVEAFLQSFAQGGKMRTCAIRATGVYGLTYPVERSKWWGLVQAVLNGDEILSSGGGTEVHGADVARVIGEVLQRPDVPRSDIIHMSDLYVAHREVVWLARQFADKAGALPPAPARPPQNVLVCRRVGEMGLTLGGLPLLEATVGELVRAAQAGVRSKL